VAGRGDEHIGGLDTGFDEDRRLVGVAGDDGDAQLFA
jgi:hypothetical protein